MTAVSPTATSGIAQKTTFSSTPTPTLVAVTTSGDVLTYQDYCDTKHAIAVGAGVGIGVGVLVASIIVLAFIFIRRRQDRARKHSPTISPDVLVTGPGHKGDWEQYHEEQQEVVKGEGGLKHKEPPVYIKSV